MNNIIYIKTLVLSVEIYAQFFNYAPNYFGYRRTQNLDYYSNVYKKPKKRLLARTNPPEWGEASSESEYNGECTINSCPCIQCYKPKPCCKSWCNNCNPLVVVPYPVPYLIHVISDDKTTIIKQTTTTAESTTNTQTPKETTTTKPKLTTSKSTLTTENIKTDTEIFDEFTEPDYNDLETDSPPVATDNFETSTIQPNVDQFIYISTKCPQLTKNACKQKPKEMFITKYSPKNFHKKSIKGKINRIHNSNPLRDMEEFSKKNSYLAPLNDVIPITNIVAAELLSELDNDKTNYYLLRRSMPNK